MRNRNYFGESNPNWHGGKHYNNYGYMLVRCNDKNHPNNVYGYVLEHRLVMEEFLGRYLTKDESVHHKNGIRDDNRIENLRLMTPKQHQNHHHIKDMSNRLCFLCGSNKTPKWFLLNKKYPICQKCRRHRYYVLKNEYVKKCL